MFLSDEGPKLETLDFAFYIGWNAPMRTLCGPKAAIGHMAILRRIKLPVNCFSLIDGYMFWVGLVYKLRQVFKWCDLWYIFFGRTITITYDNYIQCWNQHHCTSIKSCLLYKLFLYSRKIGIKLVTFTDLYSRIGHWPYAQNVRLYFLYRKYTNLFIFWFVSEHCLRSTLRLF